MSEIPLLGGDANPIARVGDTAYVGPLTLGHARGARRARGELAYRATGPRKPREADLYGPEWVVSGLNRKLRRIGIRTL